MSSYPQRPVFKMSPACDKSLNAECFATHPKWARQAFAWRLLHLMFPGQITKKLPPSLAFPPLPPGFEWPATIEIPPGTEIPDWWIHTEDWLPGDVFPPGATIPPDVDIPLWFLYSILFPPGTIIPPGFVLPPGWQPGDPLPPGVIPPGDLPPDVPGTVPPSYLDPSVTLPPPSRVPPRLILPNEILVEIITSTEDGLVSRTDFPWADCRDASSGDTTVKFATWYSIAIFCTNAEPLFIIKRTFFYFDLASIPSGKTIVSCDLVLFGNSNEYTKFCFQEGTQGASLGDSDFSAWTGPSFGEYIFPGPYDTNMFSRSFAFNATGLTFLESKFGSMAKICCREHQYDFLDDDSFPGGYQHRTRMRFAEGETQSERPRLSIIYEK